MAWECACGISNLNEAFRCAGCGWSREESNPNNSDVEDQQPVGDLNKGLYKKWGIGKAILLTFLLPMVFEGIKKNVESPDVLLVLLPLGILFLIWAFLP